MSNVQILSHQPQSLFPGMSNTYGSPLHVDDRCTAGEPGIADCLARADSTPLPGNFPPAFFPTSLPLYPPGINPVIMPGTNREGNTTMQKTTTPAGAGRKIGAFLSSALILCIVAGALALPAMAAGNPGQTCITVGDKEVCVDPIIAEPVIPSPCCHYGSDGTPYCMGLGHCTMNPPPGIA